MSKKIKHEGAEIIISIPCQAVHYRGEKHEAGSEISARHAYSEAERIAKVIRRNLGNYETPCASADWRMVSEPVCEHCGSKWTETSADYNGGCCDRDQGAEDDRQQAKNDNSQFGVGA